MSAPEALLAWHEALNAGDAERVTSLSHPEVEVVGLRGSLPTTWASSGSGGSAAGASSGPIFVPSP